VLVAARVVAAIGRRELVGGHAAEGCIAGSTPTPSVGGARLATQAMSPVRVSCSGGAAIHTPARPPWTPNRSATRPDCDLRPIGATCGHEPPMLGAPALLAQRGRTGSEGRVPEPAVRAEFPRSRWITGSSRKAARPGPPGSRERRSSDGVPSPSAMSRCLGSVGCPGRESLRRRCAGALGVGGKPGPRRAGRRR
jgi:hypothetical protein